jgi:hypothetical protein
VKSVCVMSVPVHGTCKQIFMSFYIGDLLKRVWKVKVWLKLDRNIRHLHEDLSTFYIFGSEMHGTIIKKNLLLHFHSKSFNIHLSFHCKSYSCKVGRLISVLKRAKTLTQHIVILYTHCLPCLLFCLCFFVFVLYRVHKLYFLLPINKWC